MDKEQIRQDTLKTRKEFFGLSDYINFSARSCKKIIDYLSTINSLEDKITGLYYPINGEVDIRNVYDKLERSAFARVNSESCIEYVEVKNLYDTIDLKPYSQDLLILAPSCMPDVLIIPGIAFDRQYNRLGYGKGHFDKFLSKGEKLGYQPLKIGVCFDFQLQDSLPVEEHDEKMDVIITETMIL